MKSNSRTKAILAYRERNPETTYYHAKHRNAKSFIASTTKKFDQAVAAVGIERYRKDLENLRDLIDKKLTEI